MRRLKIEAHQSLEAIEKRYRSSQGGIERSQWPVIWLLASGHKSEAVAAVTGYSLDWIRKLAQRYNAQGTGGMGDQRHGNRGRTLSLSVYQQKQLKHILKEAAERGEVWSGVQVAAWMSERLKRRIYPQRGWEMLRRLGFRPKVGRPRHVKANAAEQSAYKKRSFTE